MHFTKYWSQTRRGRPRVAEVFQAGLRGRHKLWCEARMEEDVPRGEPRRKAGLGSRTGTFSEGKGMGSDTLGEGESAGIRRGRIDLAHGQKAPVLKG